ncbi:hypothetical protein DL93DRAFT_2087484 [Clavulina sp. PMI_390]|nr:hypothetical protein DL93DRAFT_2092040 [Clavulina sp. PMI_390]KAF8307922.1 hypothetical protein DL93DRAFT_2087484 [Clavulina sp. PMI_390]
MSVLLDLPLPSYSERAAPRHRDPSKLRYLYLPKEHAGDGGVSTESDIMEDIIIAQAYAEAREIYRGRCG